MKLPPKKIQIAQQTIKDMIEHHLYAWSIIDDGVDVERIEIDWEKGFDYNIDSQVPLIIYFKQPTRVTKVKGGISISFND